MIDGTTDPRFAAVRDAFASCFTDGLQQGGAVAVMLDGRIVADLWGGHADAAGTRPWARDTLVNVWSSTKGIVSLAMAQLVARGKLHYDRPVAAAWPEFAAGGKAAITLDLVLSHRSGLDGLSVPMTIEQVYAWTPYVDALAAMAPLWEPGSRFMYHALSFGHLAGEPLRRVDGRSVGRYVAEEIAGPLGVPFYIGLPDSEDHRVAELIAGPGSSDWVTFNLASPYPHSCRNPDLVATQPNDRAWRAAEMPGVNGHADARAMATIYGTLAADPTPLLPRAAIDEATRLRFEGLEANTGTPTAFGAGFCLRDPDYGRRASARSYGHTGWGGTFAFADPEARLGFAYVTNTMLGFGDSLDPRRQLLVDAVYDRL